MIDDAGGCDWSMSHPTTGDNLDTGSLSFNTNIMLPFTSKDIIKVVKVKSNN